MTQEIIFKKQIEEDRVLNNLLNNHELRVHYEFSNTVYTDEFKEYIKNMLYDAFTSIYKKYIDTDDEYKIVSVLKSLDHL